MLSLMAEGRKLLACVLPVPAPRHQARVHA
jgi:hypothetical protein